MIQTGGNHTFVDISQKLINLVFFADKLYSDIKSNFIETSNHQVTCFLRFKFLFGL